MASSIRRKPALAVALAAVFLTACLAMAQEEMIWRRASPRGVVAEAAGGCGPVAPLQLYRFIDGLDACPEPMAPADIARLQDPFAVNVLRKGIGHADLWPASVEQAVRLVAADPAFKAHQKSYMLGEGSQIGTSVAPRDASRNLRYIVAWGATRSPSIFLSAAPAGTHPGRPAPFLQVIGYDEARNVFNYYEYTGSGGTPVRTWTWAGDSTWSRDARTAGRGCFRCHVNGALNMKELAPPWNNWKPTRAAIAETNIPAAVAGDPLYQGLEQANVLEANFRSLQSRYTRGLVASFITDGTISNVPALLKRLITTATVNFDAAETVDDDGAVDDDVVIKPGFFLNHEALTKGIGVPITVPRLAIPRARHDAFAVQNGFQLVQQGPDGPPLYARNGTTHFAFFVPVPAAEDTQALVEMLNQKVITADLAAAVLMVDFQNPVFSAPRSSLLRYASQIATARVVAPAPDPRDVPSQLTKLIAAAAAGQPPCDSARLAQCTPEQQFLHYAGQSDWKKRAADQINPYLAAVARRIATEDGIAGYMTLSLSRQAQFAGDPGVCPLNEFSLLLPRTKIAFSQCQRMNADGTIAADPQSQCNRSCL